MYAYIKGTVEDIEEDKLVVEANGIGYNIYVSGNVLTNVLYTGTQVKLYTYLNVKEDAMTLFGFLEKEELKLFRLLITVNGIGPKGAMAVLGTLSVNDLRYAIISGDSKAIAKSPGIGAKTAQKVILELKDKISIDTVGFDGVKGEESNIFASDIISEAVMALTALGYGQTEAMIAVKKCDSDKCTGVEELIKEALKRML